MTNFNIDGIHIKSFRGIKDCHLNLEKSLVLCGENGSGKSSIVNAFEYLFTGRVESLSGTYSIKEKPSLIHIGDKSEELLVEVKIGDLFIKRTLTQKPKHNDIIEDFKNGSFLLNRKKLLTFIEATPGERYENITSLIGFEELDNIENILNKTQKSFKSKLKTKKEELNSKNKSITSIYNCKIDDIYTKINEILSKNGLDEINNDTNLKEFLKEFSKKDFEKINKLSKIIELLDINISELNNDFKHLLSNYEDMALYKLKTTNNLLSILDKSSEFIITENPEKCPVCQNTIESENIIKVINLKKRELKENEIILNNWKKEYNVFIKELNTLNLKLNEIQKSLNDFNEYEFDYNLDKLINDLNKLSKFEIKLSSINDNSLFELDCEFKKLKKVILDDFEKLNDKRNHEDLSNVYKIISKILDKEIIENELEILKKQYNIAKNTYELFKKEKKKTLKNIITKIEDNVNKYYNFIHKDETFNSPQINVPKSKGLTLNLNFNDINADPRQYSSEGHLDSLGLCIFLAFVKEFNKYNFIILDDIISTVDLAHKEKVADLLFTEFKDYKFIITTHNKLWLRQIKNNAIKHKIRNKIVFSEIRKLDKFSGPVLSNYKVPEELIEMHISNGDTYAAGNAIRRYLESVLEDVCMVNQIPVPLKEHLMVNDYFESIKQFFNKVINKNSKPEIKEFYDNVFEKLDRSRYMGNLLSHNDEDNNYISINEIENFKDAVFAFEKSMKCDKHNAYLKFDKKAKIAECTKDKCRNQILLKKE